MWTVLLGVAYGSCIASPEQTIPRLETLAPHQPILADSTWGTAEHLARRLRLRGPDGKLVAVHRETLDVHARLVPKNPLSPGTHVVEERGDYGADGRRLFWTDEAVDHQGWFPSWRVQVVPTSSSAGPEPAVTWSFTESRPNSLSSAPLLTAEVVTDEQAAWVELEVDGVGVVDLAPWAYRGAHHVSTYANERCNDTGNRMRLLPGDVTARVVAHGPEGWTAASPWTTLSPTDAAQSHGLPHAGPTGRVADVRELDTWRRIRGGEPSTPTQTLESTCGQLRSVSTEVTQGKALVDDDGQVHVLAASPEGWTLDGQPLDLPEGGASALAAHDDALFVVEATDPPRLSRFEAGARVATYLPPSAVRFDVEADDEGVLLRGFEAEGRRWRQRLSLDLVPQGDPTPVRYPIHLAGGSLNGHVVDEPRGRHWLSERHVAFATKTEVTVYDADATLVHTVPVPDGAVVRQVAVDPEGVKMELTHPRRRESSLHGVDWSGEPIEVLTVPAPAEPPTWRPTELPFRGGAVVRAGQRVFVRDPDGASSPALPASSRVLGVDGDHVVMAMTFIADDRTRQLRVERFACSGEALGVPDRWLP